MKPHPKYSVCGVKNREKVADVSNGWSLSCITFLSEIDCECIKWDQCSWSNDAFIRAKGLSRESEEYEEIKEKIREHTCGESSQYMVYCCSSNQGSLNEIKALETGMIVCIDRQSGSHVLDFKINGHTLSQLSS